MSSNPFSGIDEKKLPKGTETDYHKDCDKYIIEYMEVEHVKMVGDKDTDFVKTVSVEESSRVLRQDYLDEQAGDVGILNIMQKVAVSGDVSLLNQTHRVSIPGSEKDALGRPVEDVLDLSDYSGVDRVTALTKFKEGAATYQGLDSDLKGDKSLEEVAKMSDAEIDAYLEARTKAILAHVAAVRESSSKTEGE